MTLEEFKKEVDRNIKNLFNKANNEEKELLNSMINTINNLSEREQELITYLKEEINNIELELVMKSQNDYELGKLQGYYKSCKEILSKIEKR